MSIEEFASNTPVNPPTVKRKINPKDHNMGASKEIFAPTNVANQLNTFTPVGIAIIIVADVK
jgi:hypothetical protein